MQRIGRLYPRRAFQERLGNFRGLGGLLGNVSRVMPTAEEGNHSTLMSGNNILVAHTVFSRNGRAASQTEKEIDQPPYRSAA